MTKVTLRMAQGWSARTAWRPQFHETHKVSVSLEKSRVERDQLRKPQSFHRLAFKSRAALGDGPPARLKLLEWHIKTVQTI